jgi:CheY-like chemotaxis protein
VVSAPGLGATFSAFLPTYVLPHAASPLPAEAQAAANIIQAGATILVVDDEPAVRRIAARSLEGGGFYAIQASDGAHALELIERFGLPSLILTDVMMPGMGGPELARRLHERWPMLPILFMSGYSAEDLYGQGGMGSTAHVIQKPFTPGGLVDRVAAALAQAASEVIQVFDAEIDHRP